MYLNEYAARIRDKVPADLLPPAEADDLFRTYAVLMLAKGTQVTLTDVHDAWAGWMAGIDPDHPALIPYPDLPGETARQDKPFLVAIHQVAAERDSDLDSDLDPVLFPNGVPTSNPDRALAFQLYKVMVASSEALVSRRQGANAFFLTLNGALLTAIGLIVGRQSDPNWQAGGLLVLTATGLVLSQAWISLIRSFGKLNAGKFAVINRLEQLFPAAVYQAEWAFVREGRDAQRYRTFTSREIWVPYLTTVVYALATVGCALVLAGVWSPA